MWWSELYRRARNPSEELQESYLRMLIEWMTKILGFSFSSALDFLFYLCFNLSMLYMGCVHVLHFAFLPISFFYKTAKASNGYSFELIFQVLQERGESTSRHGRATFSVLLFQVTLNFQKYIKAQLVSTEIIFWKLTYILRSN